MHAHEIGRLCKTPFPAEPYEFLVFADGPRPIASNVGELNSRVPVAFAEEVLDCTGYTWAPRMGIKQHVEFGVQIVPAVDIQLIDRRFVTVKDFI
jgi:hypothetical protein